MSIKASSVRPPAGIFRAQRKPFRSTEEAALDNLGEKTNHSGQPTNNHLELCQAGQNAKKLFPECASLTILREICFCSSTGAEGCPARRKEQG